MYEINSEKHQTVLRAVQDAKPEDILPTTYETEGMLALCAGGVSKLLFGQDTPMYLSKMEVPACNITILQDEGMGEEDVKDKWKGGCVWVTAIGKYMNFLVGSCYLSEECLWDFAAQYRQGRAQYEWPGYWAILQCPFCAKLATPTTGGDKLFMIVQLAHQVKVDEPVQASRFIPRLCCQHCFNRNLMTTEEGDNTREAFLNYSILPTRCGGLLPKAYELGTRFEFSGLSSALGNCLAELTAKIFSKGTEFKGRISKSKTKANRGQPYSIMSPIVRPPCHRCGLVSSGCRSCSKCDQTFYCGRNCQVKDWKTHKPLCKPDVEVKAPKPSQVIKRTKSRDQEAQNCSNCPNSIQEGTPIMCIACGTFIVCGACATLPKFGGCNARLGSISYFCTSCQADRENANHPADLAIFLQRLLDKEPTGKHVKYARLMLAQMKLHDMPEITGTKKGVDAAREEYMWLANNLDYAPAQLAMASFYDPYAQCCWDGPILFHLLGNGIEESPFAPSREFAIAYYERSAEHEWSLALTTVGTMYKNGILFPQDLERASFHLEKAATLGDAKAAFNISMMYTQGHGVEPNYIKGLAFANKAANHGLFQAMFVLGQFGLQDPRLREDGRNWVAKLVEEKWEPPTPEMATVMGRLRRVYDI